jgi:transposase
MMDSLVLPWAHTEMMSIFLAEVGRRHRNEFVLRVMDQAGGHLTNKLRLPDNLRLIFLPPYSPELNPAEHVWKTLREDCFGNHVFRNLDAVEHVLCDGIVVLENNPSRVQSFSGFKWITSI